MDRHIARIDVSPEYLAKALHLPEGTDIIGAEVKRRMDGYAVSLTVEHADLPPVADTEEAPEITPVVQYHRESWEFDWNVPQVIRTTPSYDVAE